MRFSTQFAATTLLASAAHAAWKEGCKSAKWDSQEDFWLNKYEPNESLPFVPTYNGTYVTIRNRQRRYVVLHCSDERPPTSAVGEEALFVKVPIESVEVHDGFTQDLIDMLGMSSAIKRTGAYADVTNSCIRGNMLANRTFDESKWDQTEPANVTFYGNVAASDPKKVLIYSNGGQAPLVQLAYIKFLGMFWGMEETANEIYSKVSANYRCAAARIEDLVIKNEFPKGAWISAIQSNGKELTVFQNDWWNVLAADAGSNLVNVSSEAKAPEDAWSAPGAYIMDANKESVLSKESFAIIDTSYYDQVKEKNVVINFENNSPRVDVKNYAQRSGMGISAFAIKEKNVYLSDKATNRNLRHNFFDRGLARPDLALLDLISVLKPGFNSGYTTAFLRSIEKPDEMDPQRSMDSQCVKKGEEVSSLKLNECKLPEWATGYHAAGVSADAYGRNGKNVKSLALDGKSSGLTGGQKAGISVGSIVGGLLVISAAVFGVMVCKRKRSTQKTKEMEEGKLDSPSPSIKV
ncbi:periplasmic binding protein [Aaosphaeria arxii CBS 175.79]|uniref:Periplasmic binding protein n=1 Tax=Aaosphaeria arxii CBS 175.79 TaxID=1450172 RepID=A0A6A5XQ69_9PLEO|nr:periplasmic binding protein [Aaosphaeria arxii CBS 175.79]KAF2015046.1 periplasmic binding protein [Aaosphaeria arxii CBS 175.79]